MRRSDPPVPNEGEDLGWLRHAHVLWHGVWNGTSVEVEGPCCVEAHRVALQIVPDSPELACPECGAHYTLGDGVLRDRLGIEDCRWEVAARFRRLRLEGDRQGGP